MTFDDLCTLLYIGYSPNSFLHLLYYFLEIFRFLTTIPLLNDESLFFSTFSRFALRFS